MLNANYRQTIRALVLSSFLLICGAEVSAQTPAPSPTPNPFQREATQPPGTEPQNPTAPPGAQQRPPQAPPAAPVVPGVNAPGQTPVATPSPTPEGAPVQEPREPVFPQVEPKPLPPLPNMTRLGVSSQNALTLSMNEAIRRALQNNNDIEVARDDVRFAETQLRVLQGVYDPIFSITPQIDKRITPQQSTLGGSGRTGTTTSTVFTASPSITKAFELGGGNYTLTFANTHTNTSSTFSFLNPFYSSNLSLTFTQPLLRNRSIDNNRRQIRIQRKHLEQSDADFRLRTIQVITQVQQAYWELVFALRDQQNQLANVNLSRENLKNVEAQIAAGAKAPLERAEVQTELASRESALLLAVQNVSVAENNLKQLIFKDFTAPEWSAQVTPTDTPAFAMNAVNLEEALAEARRNRPELQRLRLQKEINKIDVQFFKNQTHPQIDIQSTLATTGLAGKNVSGAAPAGTFIPLISGDPNANGNAFLLQQIRDIQVRGGFPVTTTPLVAASGGPPTKLVGGYGQTLRNLFSFQTRNITVGIAIQIPFTNKTAEAQLAGARIQQEQLDASMRAQEQTVEVDVRNAAQAVETARLRVVTAREARANAELQLEGEQRLYQVGRSTTFLLFQRENSLTNARNQELRAETDYNKALADLQRATSTTMSANNVVVDKPVGP